MQASSSWGHNYVALRNHLNYQTFRSKHSFCLRIGRFTSVSVSLRSICCLKTRSYECRQVRISYPSKTWQDSARKYRRWSWCWCCIFCAGMPKIGGCFRSSSCSRNSPSLAQIWSSPDDHREPSICQEFQFHIKICGGGGFMWFLCDRMLAFQFHRLWPLTWFWQGVWTQNLGRTTFSSCRAFRFGQIIFGSISIRININWPHLRGCCPRSPRGCFQCRRNWHRGSLRVVVHAEGEGAVSQPGRDWTTTIPWQPNLTMLVLLCSNCSTSANLMREWSLIVRGYCTGGALCRIVMASNHLTYINIILFQLLYLIRIYRLPIIPIFV